MPGHVGEDGELELAVFRFTLGIPGFDDAYIPRVAGAGGLLLLALNHFLSPGPPPDAQVLLVQAVHVLLAFMMTATCPSNVTQHASMRINLQATSEVLATVLATICIASPTIEARLKELEPGRGRQAAAQQIEGASRVFSIADNLSLDQKQVCTVTSLGIATFICDLKSSWLDSLSLLPRLQAVNGLFEYRKGPRLTMCTQPPK